MRGKTYVYFNGKTEYIGTGGEEQTAYPLGALVFGTLDVDWEPYLEQARALRRAYTGVDSAKPARCRSGFPSRRPVCIIRSRSSITICP